MSAAEQAAAVERLAAMVRIPTVSDRDPAGVDTAAFDRLLATMAEQWPLVHGLEVTRVGGHGLLIHWPGQASDRPVVLMAHLDVVPAGDGWTREPFGGEVADGAVWGRGTLDDKGCAAGICEAVEALLADGFVPAQDVWLSFGCDEEVSGGSAEAAVAELRGRGVRPWFVLDEGGAVAHEAFPGVAAPIGVVGVTEKGITSLEMTVSGGGGHASMPARLGPTARLARAITRLDKSAAPARVPAPTVELLRRMAPHAPRALRPLLANAGRLAPVLARALVAAGPESAAMVRTTFAVTTLEGSPALNVIASTARAGVNIRVMVGETVAGAVEHVRAAIRDEQVRIRVIEAAEPSPVSPYTSLESDGPETAAFALLEGTISEVFPDAVPSPYVMMMATDGRHFTAISDQVYRFAPFRMTKSQRASIHGADEHITIEAYLAGIRWYRRLIERL